MKIGVKKNTYYIDNIKIYNNWEMGWQNTSTVVKSEFYWYFGSLAVDGKRFLESNAS